MDNIHMNFYKIPNKIYELGLPKNELLVLNYLLSLVNYHTIHPSKKTIASKTGVSKRTVDKAISFLVDNGFLEYKKGFGIGTKRLCNQYKIFLDKIDPECTKKSQKQADRENTNEMDCMEMIRKSVVGEKGVDDGK